MSALVVLDDVHITYGRGATAVLAIESVSLEIQKGRVYCRGWAIGLWQELAHEVD